MTVLTKIKSSDVAKYLEGTVKASKEFNRNSKASRTNNRFIGKTLRPLNPFGESDIMRKGGGHIVPKRPKHNVVEVDEDLGDDEPVGMGLPEHDPSYSDYLAHKYGNEDGSCYEEEFDPLSYDGQELEEDLYNAQYGHVHDVDLDDYRG